MAGVIIVDSHLATDLVFQARPWRWPRRCSVCEDPIYGHVYECDICDRPACGQCRESFADGLSACTPCMERE